LEETQVPVEQATVWIPVPVGTIKDAKFNPGTGKAIIFSHALFLIAHIFNETCGEFYL